MAATYLCDGCGSPVLKPKVVGFVVKRDYCETCAQKAEAFLEGEELLRQTAYGSFYDARQALIAGTSLNKLPDVP